MGQAQLSNVSPKNL